ncbi:hypothetical protein AA15669_1157 [Saccharibacter floricola DSM 15669]|uniref:Uncharacterized protein n=1 Tax=Saccharibacter floricola DSM 15669 TaxID=1123227 RepID=A0ABQ0NYX2_9PROT|nr:hypothetical protein AA15669_1157 [Saccharibacter floricola DSM 15669]
MRKSDHLSEILIHPKSAGDRARYLRDLKGMRQTCSEKITLMIEENLRLILQRAKTRRMENAVTVTLPR